MRYLALATDYDGTLASSGKVKPSTVEAILKLKASGRRAMLVTGRRLQNLQDVFPEYELFDYIICENGAVVYQPSSQRKEFLADPLPDRFIERLGRIGIQPLEVGEIILSTHSRYKESVLNAIYELGLEAQLTFNGESTMVLPQGISKATGMERALQRMGLSFHEVVGIGDSANDHSLLRNCECPIAVANAVATIKESAVYVTRCQSGDGVEEIISELLQNDLAPLAPSLTHNHIELGKRLDGQVVWMPAFGQNILIAGPSGSGKSTFATGFIERLLMRQYQVCIVDPEGDYGTLQDVVAIGNSRRPPSVNEILGILENPKISVSVNLLGISLADRPQFLSHLLPSLQMMRSRTGRPQWILIDEVHHVFPSSWSTTELTLPKKLGETIFLTVHPDQVARPILKTVDTVVAVGAFPNRTLAQFSEAAGETFAGPLELPEGKNQVIAWMKNSGQGPFIMEAIAGHSERLRHLRKYAEGDLGNHSFYFTGVENRLHLKAQNLMIFSQIAEGLDEETWSYHLSRGDYSRWFKEQVKDLQLYDETRRIEKRKDLKSQDARKLILELIRARYSI
jgi:hydroxymethylpyrimidine pyrophosphatase-like HAD family hydrolase/archaellum biogenesis ATPase FlaH